MNILQICPRIPYPLHDGGAIGIYNITKHLAIRGHNITMITFSKDVAEPPEELGKYCNLKIVHASTGHSLIKLGQSILWQLPYLVSKYQNHLFYKMVDREMNLVRYDIVHADHLAMAPYAVYLKKKYNVPIILREHNLETVLFERMSNYSLNPLSKWFSTLEGNRVKKYESRISEEFNFNVMITEDDENRLKNMNSSANTCVIPAGIDVKNPSSTNMEEGKTILFLASLDWKPNVDGFFWFYNNVLPILLQKDPNVTVTIVGRGESKKLKSITNPHVNFVGYVQDVSDYIRKTQVCIVPLFVGSGMRIKILEMLSFGKPIVSTSIGCEGIGVKDKRDILIADTSEDFAAALINIFEDKQLKSTIMKNAYELIKNNYRWDNIAEKFEQIYMQACNL